MESTMAPGMAETVLEYRNSLEDLKVNSKPLINMLTILAEEGIAHAPAVVQIVEKRLDEVPPEEKLPILYLVDSIIKNVGKAYVQLFTQVIVRMFTNVFKQVDEKIRSQMFKLRETWHEVFPSNKLYQLDVKVSLIDPAWPIQAQLAQSSMNNIHFNPLFIMQNPGVNTMAPIGNPEEILKRKTEELRLLTLKREQIEQQKALLNVNHSIRPAIAPTPVNMMTPHMPTGRIAPVNPELVSHARRRDPRLARQQINSQPTPTPLQVSQTLPTAPQVATVSSSLDRIDRNLKKNYEDHDKLEKTSPRKDPRLTKKDSELSSKSPTKSKGSKSPRKSSSGSSSSSSNKNKSERRDDRDTTKSKVNKLPPIPKIKRHSDTGSSPSKRRKDSSSSSKSNDRKSKKSSESKSKSSRDSSEKLHQNKPKQSSMMEINDNSNEAKSTDVTFKELKSSLKDRNYRNREKSPSPDDEEIDDAPQIRPPMEPVGSKKSEANNLSSSINAQMNGALNTKDVDLRQIHNVNIAKKRKSDEVMSLAKKSKLDKFNDSLFGNQDVDLRTLNAPIIAPDIVEIDPSNPEFVNEDGGWARVKETTHIDTPMKDATKNKLKNSKETDSLGRPFLYKSTSVDTKSSKRRTKTSEDTDMRLKGDKVDEEDSENNIKIIMSQATDEFKSGQIDNEQYNTMLLQVLSINEKQKFKAARKKDSIETFDKKKYFNPDQPSFSDEDYYSSPRSDASPRSPLVNDVSSYGDIDERIANPPIPNMMINSSSVADSQEKKSTLLPKPDCADTDLRNNSYMNNDNYYMGDSRWSGRGGRPYGPRGGWRGRSKDEWRHPRSRGPPSHGVWRGPGIKPFDNRFQSQNGPRQGIIDIPLPLYTRDSSPPPLGGKTSREIDPPDPRIMEYIHQDAMKSICIDGQFREIRYYGTTAITMMGVDDPREIYFLPGQRRIHLDGESYVLRFNEDYINVTIDGQPHKIKFGAPTRELIIDNQWFECYFGGQPVQIMINGNLKQLRIEGPPPQVAIGEKQRSDLVLGRISLIIDGSKMQPIFLDAKPQLFVVNGYANSLRFVDSLQTVLINEKPFKVDYGDLPKSIFIANRKHYLRFSTLPKHVVPGKVHLANMQGLQPINDNATISTDNENSQSALYGGLDLLASVMPSTIAPASQFTGYSMGDKSMESTNTSATTTPALLGNVSAVLQNINVNDLFEKLVSSGIVKTAADTSSLQVVLPPVTEKKEKKVSTSSKTEKLTKNVANLIKPVNLMHSETLRTYQPGLISALYSGMQCGSCGVRFPPEHTVRYSQHLDWHYRQNKAEKDSQRRPHSRRWYYDITDWVQYEEIEDLEEREKSWFENQQQAAETENSEATAARLAQQQQEAASVPAGQAPQDLRCELCRDAFDQFYHEESEEWHLRKAVRHEDKNYHPLCLEEYKASLVETKEEEISPENADSTMHDDTLTEKPSETEQPIEIVNLENTTEVEENGAEKDNESIVEVLSECQSEVASQDDTADIEVVEEDDDVVLKVDPVEQIVVDDADTDEETEKVREERDKEFDLSKIDFSKVKIKQEPIDPEDEPIITSTEVITTQADTTQAAVISSIDGNVQLEPTIPILPTIPAGGIRINISKAINPAATKDKDAPSNNAESNTSSNEPPPGEELVIEYSLKPALQGVNLTKRPIVKKGSELSGLCSIM